MFLKIHKDCRGETCLIENLTRAESLLFEPTFSEKYWACFKYASYEAVKLTPT